MLRKIFLIKNLEQTTIHNKCHGRKRDYTWEVYLMERTHKRKRSLQDSTVDLSKVRMALNCLESLKEELNRIEETEEELQTITDNVHALEDILRSAAKKPVR